MKDRQINLAEYDAFNRGRALRDRAFGVKTLRRNIERFRQTGCIRHRINHQSPMPTVVRRERPSWRGKPFDGGCPVKRTLVGLKRTRSSEEVGSGG